MARRTTWFAIGVGVGVASTTWGRRRLRRVTRELVPAPPGVDPVEVARRLAGAVRAGREEMRRAEASLRSSWGLEPAIEVQVGGDAR